jgi:hypothetical protein
MAQTAGSSIGGAGYQIAGGRGMGSAFPSKQTSHLAGKLLSCRGSRSGGRARARRGQGGLLQQLLLLLLQALGFRVAT